MTDPTLKKLDRFNLVKPAQSAIGVKTQPISLPQVEQKKKTVQGTDYGWGMRRGAVQIEWREKHKDHPIFALMRTNSSLERNKFTYEVYNQWVKDSITHQQTSAEYVDTLYKCFLSDMQDILDLFERSNAGTDTILPNDLPLKEFYKSMSQCFFSNKIVYLESKASQKPYFNGIQYNGKKLDIVKQMPTPPIKDFLANVTDNADYLLRKWVEERVWTTWKESDEVSLKMCMQNYMEYCEKNKEFGVVVKNPQYFGKLLPSCLYLSIRPYYKRRDKNGVYFMGIQLVQTDNETLPLEPSPTQGETLLVR